jgi:hypothetical protein
MITISQAQEKGKTFAKEQGEILPGVYYSISNAKEYKDCYYFNFLLSDKDGRPLQNPPLIAGAPGFIVDKTTGNLEVISFGRLSKLI